MRVLTVNPGSSSVKLGVVDDDVEWATRTVDVATASDSQSWQRNDKESGDG